MKCQSLPQIISPQQDEFTNTSLELQIGVGLGGIVEQRTFRV